MIYRRYVSFQSNSHELHPKVVDIFAFLPFYIGKSDLAYLKISSYDFVV